MMSGHIPLPLASIDRHPTGNRAVQCAHDLAQSRGLEPQLQGVYGKASGQDPYRHDVGHVLAIRHRDPARRGRLLRPLPHRHASLRRRLNPPDVLNPPLLVL